MPGAAHLFAHVLDKGGSAVELLLPVTEDYLFRLAKSFATTETTSMVGVRELLTSGLYLVLLRAAVSQLGNDLQEDLVEALHSVFFSQAQIFAQKANGTDLNLEMKAVVNQARCLAEACSSNAPISAPRCWLWWWEALCAVHDCHRAIHAGQQGSPTPALWVVAFYLHGVLATREVALRNTGLDKSLLSGTDTVLDLLTLLTVCVVHGSLAAFRRREFEFGREALGRELGDVRQVLTAAMQKLQNCDAALTRWRFCPGYNHPPAPL